MEVRAQLTTEAAVRRSQGRDEPILRYDGYVVDVTSESVALDVLVARASSGLADVVIRDTVRIPNAEIQTMMRRELAVGRTALFTAAAAAGAVVVFLSVDQLVGATDDPPDDGTPHIRAPLLNWRTLRFLLGSR